MSFAVRYHVGLQDLHEHLFAVETHLPAGDHLLWLPAWTPGSYLIREYARHLQELRASDAEGQAVPVERVAKDAFRVRASSELTLRYRVYAFDLTVRTSHLDSEHGYFNGATLFLTSDALRGLPCHLSLSAPDGWRGFCALPAAEGGWAAKDYDELVDSPMEIGPHEPLGFTAAGKPHQIVVHGRGNFVPERLVADLARICETEARLFGGLPHERYLFILHLTDKGRGGLEHKASSSLLYPRFGFASGKSYEDFLALAAHEYFHLWNVKRITPKAFVPFDYRRECYTRLLWAMEGVTSYYDTLMLRRARLLDARRYLERLGEAVTTIESLPARKVQSLAEASLLAWIKHYRPDEHTPNSGISYYVKGEVVAMLLDLQLREATGGQRSLDDLMRLLFERYGDGRGVPEDGVEQAAQELAGAALAPFFARSVHSIEELDYSVLASAGLALRRRGKTGPADKGGTADGDGADKPWLGAELRPGDKPVVANVYSGSPAARAGLYADDEIVAIDGYRAGAGGLQDRLNERRPGDRIRLAVFRRDELREVEVELAPRPAVACWFEKLPNATDAQKRRFQEWLDEPFDAPPPPRKP